MNNFLILMLLLTIPCMVLGKGKEKPDYIIKRTTGPIYVDGYLNEPDWKNAESIGDLVFPWYEKGKKEQTIVKMLWDDTFLYISYFCEDEHISATRTQKNTDVWLDDCVECFVAPNPSSPLDYTNYEFNCLGTYLVGVHINKKEFLWEPEGIQIGRSHKGTINKEDDIDSYWILEVAIPFKNFKRFNINIPPKPGEYWFLNINRCGGVVNEQYSQWSPSDTPEPQFHVPSCFGKVIFSK